MRLFVLSLLGAAAAFAGDDFTGELRVILWKSLPSAPGREARAANLVLDLEAENGRWGRAYGLAQSYNNGLHEGIVTRGTVTGNAFTLRVDLIIGDDQWVKGGHAGYDVAFTRDAAGNLTGTFDGVFKGTPIAGKVTGEVKPPRPILVKDFVPLDPDEHPRVLFRKRDLPALREKLNTPFGQQYFAAASRKSGLAPWAYDLINISVLHQLTGDTNYAASAKLIVERMLDSNDVFVTDGMSGSGGCGIKVSSVALALDLCWDAWPAEFRKTVTDRLRQEVPMLLKFLYCTSHANTHPCSNYYGPGYGGPCLAALVLWGLKGDEPAKPVDPVTRLKPLTPPADFKPGEGVPTVDFVLEKTPDKWLLGGPVTSFFNGDPLGQLGGSFAARPSAGVTAQQFAFVDGKPQSTKLTFDPMTAKFMTANGVDLVALAGGTNGPVTVALFAALKVGAEQVVGLARGQRDAQVYLGGVQLTEFDYYKLAPGLYPLLVTYSTEAAAGALGPMLAALDSKLRALKLRRDKYEMELALWRLNHDYWEQSGGRDVELNWALHASRQRMYQHYRLGMGDGGWQAEAGPHYSDIAAWFPINYATAYLKMFGRQASPYPDVSLVPARRLMQVVFGAGKPAVQPLSSSAGFDVDKVAAAWPIMPAQYKPALLWGWQKLAGNAILNDGGLKLANAFLHYPLDAKAEEPGKVMPLQWQAPTFGFECFRNGWNGADDFVGQVFAKASLVKGWNHPEAGTFRLYGLGHPWVVGSYDRVGFRDQEPCVLLPLDETEIGGCGRYTHRQVWPDGSGAVTIDLHDVYASNKSQLTDSNLLRLPDGFVDAGIRGLRAVAFDYSGKSGAPCLFVLVDQIAGGKERWWQWTLDQAGISRTKATPNGFTIDYGDASLVATFITPASPKVEVLSENVRLGDIGNKHGSYEGPLHRVKVAGKESFYLVATIQKKDAPAVKVEATGLDAKVTVGGQTVRFDGAKIVLGE